MRCETLPIFRPRLLGCVMTGGRSARAMAALTLLAAVAPAGSGSAAASPVIACRSSMVHLHHHFGGVGLGHGGMVFTVVNVSRAACSVSGYLRVSELTSHNVVLLRAQSTGPQRFAKAQTRPTPPCSAGKPGTGCKRFRLHLASATAHRPTSIKKIKACRCAHP